MNIRGPRGFAEYLELSGYHLDKCEGVSTEEMASIEKRYRFKFPRQYAEFLRGYGRKIEGYRGTCDFYLNHLPGIIDQYRVSIECELKEEGIDPKWPFSSNLFLPICTRLDDVFWGLICGRDDGPDDRGFAYNFDRHMKVAEYNNVWDLFADVIENSR